MGTLPVELSSFSVVVKDNVVVLNWTTATEVNNFGFSVEHKLEIANHEWEELAFVNGHGNRNYPNPFNPTTVISYTIPKTSYVSVKVFDVLSNKISVLVNESQGIGSYNVNFNASALSNGLYLYRITAGEFTSVKKCFY